MHSTRDKNLTVPMNSAAPARTSFLACRPDCHPSFREVSRPIFAPLGIADSSSELKACFVAPGPALVALLKRNGERELATVAESRFPGVIGSLLIALPMVMMSFEELALGRDEWTNMERKDRP